MNEQPIEAAQDEDIRLSVRALLRAAHRAREIAAMTGTEIVVSRYGVIEKIRPELAVNPAESRRAR
jgi:hypothetical protein